jgi:hypothetical protein
VFFPIAHANWRLTWSVKRVANRPPVQLQVDLCSDDLPAFIAEFQLQPRWSGLPMNAEMRAWWRRRLKLTFFKCRQVTLRQNGHWGAEIVRTRAFEGRPIGEFRLRLEGYTSDELASEGSLSNRALPSGSLTVVHTVDGEEGLLSCFREITHLFFADEHWWVEVAEDLLWIGEQSTFYPFVGLHVRLTLEPLDS